MKNNSEKIETVWMPQAPQNSEHQEYYFPQKFLV